MPEQNTMNSIEQFVELSVLTVVHREEKIDVDSYPQSFCDFDGWVRSRFGLHATDKIRYLNGQGKEIIPSAAFFVKEDYIEVVSRTCSEKSSSLKNDVSTPVIPSSFTDDSLNFFHYYGAPILILLIALAMTPQFGKYIDFVLNFRDAGTRKHCEGVLVDCYVNFLCWSSTYLFVRRLLNPETSSVVFKKFSSDAFYGGLAAASTALMKPILTSALHT